MNKLLINNSHRYVAILIHIIGWGIIFGFPFFFISRDGQAVAWLDYLRHSAVPISFMVAFYANYFVLIPRYLFEQQTKRYVLLNLLLVVAVTAVLHLWQEFFFAMEMGTRGRNGHGHQGPPGWIFVIRDLFSLVLTIGFSVAVRLSSRWTHIETTCREAEKSKMEAELSNLKNQLNPHFLLNTLNNIYALININTDKAQSAVQELSKLLRYVLYENQDTFVPLTREVEFIGNYIELMKIRLTTNVEVNVDFSLIQGSGTVIAPLIFISLIENAFKHGVSATKKSYINISIIEKEDKRVLCNIKNSYHPKRDTDKSGSGIGLEQVSRRLELLYAGQYIWHREILEKNVAYESTLIISTVSPIKDNEI